MYIIPTSYWIKEYRAFENYMNEVGIKFRIIMYKDINGNNKTYTGLSPIMELEDDNDLTLLRLRYPNIRTTRDPKVNVIFL